MSASLLTESDLAARVGTPFPGGEVRLERWWVHLALDSVGAHPDDGPGHPALVFLIATGSMGWSWSDLFDLFSASEDDGPMAGETATTVHQPLRIGPTYRVAGEIISARRKEGRSVGVFDIVEYRLDILGDDDTVQASTTNSIIFPRRGGVAA
ncbi:hypothetical protein GIY30_23250 [Gordonia sp. HNM0687]|uniref:N-terminal of MaoC-like dehydratase domain-containing protein n=1 Tax=Gordonia mangrovi TaxID=2665643 RepID=A0A6L7GVZ3_9ACTN|nr:hypothetical protein [Gordonia mangrovi]MXP24244.1 hypothetical protein [Gordonia mangrovi]UVF79935.1 hypothetical protein NWF22_09000 [Gordonia mangrovi]